VLDDEDGDPLQESDGAVDGDLVPSKEVDGADDGGGALKEGEGEVKLPLMSYCCCILISIG
jgi:hypothetical protein